MSWWSDRHPRWAEVIALAGLLALALVPRLLGLERVATLDETAFWLERTLAFAGALRRDDWAATLQSGHPGVTTMWLGTLGLGLHALGSGRPFADLDLPAQLAALRLPLALACGLALLPGYLLLRRLLAPPTALLATLLWVSDPLLLAHSRVLHLDALLTTFFTLALLALLVALLGEPSSAADPRGPTVARYIAASGVYAGLALLTKGPALLLPPLTGLLLAVHGAQLWVRPRRLLGTYALWLGCALLTALVLWPAAWDNPLRAARAVFDELLLNGGRPHPRGNYFLGAPVDDPGPLFYGAALTLRLTPWGLVGLLLLPLALRRGDARQRQLIAALALSTLLFVALLSLSPKKFDRYLLPIFPTLDILAALGLGALLGSVRAAPQVLRYLAVALLAAVALGSLARYHPHYLSYYNPLLGGGATAQRALLVGWGEGFDEARDWLNGELAGREAVVASWVERMLRPRAAFSVVPIEELRPGPQPYPQYLVIYVSQAQRQIFDDGARWYWERATPLHTVRLHDLEYAWIYQVPPPVPQPLAARWGEALALRGYGLEGDTVRGQTLQLTLFWEARARPVADYLLFVHLIGPDGRRYAQADLAPGGVALPTSSWDAGRQVVTPLALALPAAAPPGAYRLLAGLYAAQGGARLPLAQGDAAAASLAGTDALLLATLDVR